MLDDLIKGLGWAATVFLLCSLAGVAWQAVQRPFEALGLGLLLFGLTWVLKAVRARSDRHKLRNRREDEADTADLEAARDAHDRGDLETVTHADLCQILGVTPNGRPA